VLLTLHCRRGMGVLLRDANNRRRVLRGDPTLCESGESDDEFQPEYRYNIIDPATLRFRPGDRLRLSHRFSIEGRIQANYLNSPYADTHYLEAEKTYKLTDTKHFVH
jgi:hypothetical protein